MDREEFYKKRNAAMQAVKNLFKNEVALGVMSPEARQSLILMIGCLELSEFQEPLQEDVE